MGDLTKNFSRSEFICKCGNCDQIAVDFELVTILQEAVDHFSREYNQDVSCQITSGNRCLQNNIRALIEHSGMTREEAEKSKSQHLNCIAADHKFFLKQTRHQIDPDIVGDYYEEKFPEKYGIGRYENRTYLDIRTSKARWTSS